MERMSGKKNPKDIIIYCDMDGVLCDFHNVMQQKISLNPLNQYPQCEYGFFSNLPIIDGAYEGFDFLFRNFNTYVLTAPSEKNPFSYLEKRVWLESFYGMEAVRKMIISPAKNLNVGDYLIDDYSEGKGQDMFGGTLLQFGTKYYPDWDAIIEYFNMKYKL